MNVAQSTVARSYRGGDDNRTEPELTADDGDSVNPAGKNDWGSSTVSSCVPVSCPDAAGTGVIDTVGAGAAVVGTAAADDEDDGVWNGTPLVAHPVSATAATAVSPARTRETDDTALASPNPDINT
jgi:hypothetical protein